MTLCDRRRVRNASWPLAKLAAPVRVASTRWLAALLGIACSAWLAFAASAVSVAAAADANPVENEKAEKAAPSPEAIPLAGLAAEADAASENLRSMSANDSAQKALASVEDELPALNRDVAVRARENKNVLAQHPSLDLLRQLDSRWQEVRARLSAVSSRLKEVIASLDQELARIDALEKIWIATTSLAKEQKAPPELVRRVESLLSELATARSKLETRRTQALKLQARISDIDLRVTEALQSNRKARDATLGRMFTRDSAPLWDASWREHGAARIVTGTSEAVEAQGLILRDYLQAHSARFAMHAALLAALSALFFWVRSRLGALVEKEPALARAATVVDYPLASALVLALMLTHWIYPDPPRLILAINGIAIFVPTILMLRHLVSPRLIAPLYAVLAFYFVDQARSVSASIEIVPRFLFVAEMIAAVAFLLWFSQGMRADTERNSGRTHAAAWRVAALFALVLCAASALANVAGYVVFSNLVGDAVLDSMYAGLVLYTVVQIFDALIEIAMRAGPLTALRMIRNRRVLLQYRIKRVMQWAAILVWTLYVLDLLAARDRVFDAVRSILAASATLGHVEISLSSILSFVAVIWAAFLVSRLIRFVLNEEVYPHASLKRGVPYAISRTLHFAIVALGFVIAMSVLGMEMTQVTILASAFTIGVGFGLQNIFNNFVSGLIVLFERPVQVGDVIQIDDAVGLVERIGIRASVMRTANGSEVIVPNGKLISDKVINWTLSGRQRVIELAISVVLQSNPEQVIATLERVAKEHPGVLQDPPVQAIVTRLGPDWMGFELRAAIAEAERWMTVRSELAVSAAAALRAANITLR